MDRMEMLSGWPATIEELATAQAVLATAEPPPWPAPERPRVGGCYVCFPRGYQGRGVAGEPAWAGACVYDGRRCLARAAVTGRAGGPYVRGALALRCGALLDAAVRSLRVAPDVLLLDATGYDHPRSAGLARHLGAVLDVPTVGVTHRPLLAAGDWPGPEQGARSPLLLDGMLVGYWVRTRSGRRPLAVHAGWRTDADTAAGIVLASTRLRTPEPLREARRIARTARSAATPAGPDAARP